MHRSQLDLKKLKTTTENLYIDLKKWPPVIQFLDPSDTVTLY